MTRQRLDDYLVSRHLTVSRHQAGDLVRRQLVQVNGRLGTKPGQMVNPDAVRVRLLKTDCYVSRGGDKLAGVARDWALDFRDQTVVDLGCGVGGFSDYVLQAGAGRVLAVDVGREPLAGKLQSDPRVRWQPQTDARQLKWPTSWPNPDWILLDLAFISLRQVLPHLIHLGQPTTSWLALAKPQFESAGRQLNRGIVKNSRQRREILVDLERWLRDNNWHLVVKRDASLAGAKGNLERFYRLQAPAGDLS